MRFCASLCRVLALAFLAFVSPAGAATPAPEPADAQAILRAVRAPGAKVVLLNIWATWCDPCRAEMPDMVQFYRAHQKDGLRMVLVSADDEAKAAAAFLASLGVDFPTFIKRGDDMAFINSLDASWSGELPATFLFDHRGALRERIRGATDRATLEKSFDRLTERSGRTKSTKKGSMP